MGLGGAIVIILVLFFTNVFRGQLGRSRWRDPVWLAWLMAVAYMLHNFEEHGIDAEERHFHFPVTACQTFGFPNIETCPFAPSFFVAVNVPFVWGVLPIAALWCRRNPAVGLTGAGLLLTNAMSHIVGAFTPMGYSPGTVTAAIIFIPLSVWVFATFFGPGKLLGRPILATILLASILAQVVLLGLLLSLAHRAIPLPAAIAIQTVDPVLLVVLPWIANRIWPRHRPSPLSRRHEQVAKSEGGQHYRTPPTRDRNRRPGEEVRVVHRAGRAESDRGGRRGAWLSGAERGREVHHHPGAAGVTAPRRRPRAVAGRGSVA
jgi:hypothetical protein